MTVPVLSPGTIFSPRFCMDDIVFRLFWGALWIILVFMTSWLNSLLSFFKLWFVLASAEFLVLPCLVSCRWAPITNKLFFVPSKLWSLHSLMFSIDDLRQLTFKDVVPTSKLQKGSMPHFWFYRWPLSLSCCILSLLIFFLILHFQYGPDYGKDAQFLTVLNTWDYLWNAWGGQYFSIMQVSLNLHITNSAIEK